MKFTKLTCWLFWISVTFGIDLKSYQRARVESETKLASIPTESVIECLSFCARRTQCIGALFEDAECELFEDFQLSQIGTEIMVDSDMIEFENTRNYGKVLVSSGQHTGDLTVLDLKSLSECEPLEPALNTTRLDVPTGGLLNHKYPIICLGRTSVDDDPRPFCEVRNHPIISIIPIDAKYFNGGSAYWDKSNWWISG